MKNDKLLARIGPLRIALLALAIACYPMVLLSDMQPQGIGVFTAYVTPSLVVILFFVLLLDALMNRVFMIDLSGEERGQRRLRMWLDLAAVAGLLLFWAPYFRNIGAL